MPNYERTILTFVYVRGDSSSLIFCLARCFHPAEEEIHQYLQFCIRIERRDTYQRGIFVGVFAVCGICIEVRTLCTPAITKTGTYPRIPCFNPKS